jgi:hypothetical protein
MKMKWTNLKVLRNFIDLNLLSAFDALYMRSRYFLKNLAWWTRAPFKRYCILMWYKVIQKLLRLHIKSIKSVLKGVITCQNHQQIKQIVV